MLVEPLLLLLAMVVVVPEELAVRAAARAAATVVARAVVKEAEAKRRAAARRKQQAREVMHDASVERDVAGMAQHRYLDAQAEERNAAAGLQVAQEKKQAAQAEIYAEGHSR